MKLKFSQELWKEGGMIVSYAPELDIAACGETIEQAKRNLGEVVQINLEEMRKLGTLEKYLCDAGFQLSSSEQTASVDKELIGFEMAEIAI